MSNIENIQQAILSLSKEEYDQLRQWFSELDWEEWDRLIEADSANGKLDSLIVEVEQAKQQGKVQNLAYGLIAREHQCNFS